MMPRPLPSGGNNAASLAPPRHLVPEPWPGIPQRLDVPVPHQTAVSYAYICLHTNTYPRTLPTAMLTKC